MGFLFVVAGRQGLGPTTQEGTGINESKTVDPLAVCVHPDHGST